MDNKFPGKDISLEDLKSVEGIEESIAKQIYDYFHE